MPTDSLPFSQLIPIEELLKRSMDLRSINHNKITPKLNSINNRELTKELIKVAIRGITNKMLL